MSLELVDGETYEVYAAEPEDEDDQLMFPERSSGSAPRAAFEQFRSRNRQYGNAVCPECKQSFVNSARLERHLAVHQVFGAYLCPLCGKTYKYEYNLFFHWRKTCQNLNELVKVEQRKNMDVESLRLLVEEVVVKMNETESADIGISSKALFQGSSSIQLEMPIDPQSPLARACMICGILVHRNHLPQHEALHSSSTETGLRLLDMQSPTGGFYCDLCGVAFRRKDNLYTHWRSSCPEIMANIEPGSELFLSDMELKAMVLDLLMRLRRMSRQSPLRSHHTNRDDIEEDSALSHQSEARGSQADDSSADGKKDQLASTANDEKAMVYMDDYMNPADTVVSINGELVNVIPADRRKWNIPEDGKPLECPDCFRQFANAGRLERHISGFHSHYGAYKCLLCGHRFKYDYNLLFHYRHSCAYTKLLVGADVRKLLDAASLRKLVSHIKQTDPDLRPGSSRLINIKRRPSIKPIPRNVLPHGKASEKAKLKRSLEQGKKCPVCGVMFYGQKSLDKHIGTVHLLCEKFLDKAITRDSNSPILVDKHPEPLSSAHIDKVKVAPRKNSAVQEQFYAPKSSVDDTEPPPVLEMEGPGEAVSSPARCVDINGEEITDFNAEQLSEMDMLLYSGQLALGDLVLTSNFGEEVEYRIALGTRHGSQIVLERVSKLQQMPTSTEVPETIEEDCNSQQTPERHSPLVKGDERTKEQSYHHLQNDTNVVVNSVEYTEEDELADFADHENPEIIDYHSSQLVEYEIDGAEQNGRRLVQLVDNRGQQLLQYLDEEGEPCEAYVQYMDVDNVQQMVELVDGEDGEQMVHYVNVDNMAEEEVMAYLKTQTAPSNTKDEGNAFTVKGKDEERNSALSKSTENLEVAFGVGVAFNTCNAHTSLVRVRQTREDAHFHPQRNVSSSGSNNLPEDFMQEE